MVGAIIPTFSKITPEEVVSLTDHAKDVLSAMADRVRVVNANIEKLKGELGAANRIADLSLAGFEPLDTLFRTLGRAFEKRQLSEISTPMAKAMATIEAINKAPGEHLVKQWTSIVQQIENNASDPKSLKGYAEAHEALGRVANCLINGNATGALAQVDEDKLVRGLFTGKKRAAIADARKRLANLVPQIIAIEDNEIRSMLVSGYFKNEPYADFMKACEKIRAEHAKEILAAQAEQSENYAQVTQKAIDVYLKAIHTGYARLRPWVKNMDDPLAPGAYDINLSSCESIARLFPKDELAIIQAAEKGQTPELEASTVARIKDGIPPAIRQALQILSNEAKSHATELHENMRKEQAVLVQIDIIVRNMGNDLQAVNSAGHLTIGMRVAVLRSGITRATDLLPGFKARERVSKPIQTREISAAIA